MEPKFKPGDFAEHFNRGRVVVKAVHNFGNGLVAYDIQVPYGSDYVMIPEKELSEARDMFKFELGQKVLFHFNGGSIRAEVCSRYFHAGTKVASYTLKALDKNGETWKVASISEDSLSNVVESEESFWEVGVEYSKVTKEDLMNLPDGSLVVTVGRGAGPSDTMLVASVSGTKVFIEADGIQVFVSELVKLVGPGHRIKVLYLAS